MSIDICRQMPSIESRNILAQDVRRKRCCLQTVWLTPGRRLASGNWLLLRGDSAVIGNSAVFFDVDGVLVDSLPEHLRICADLAEQFHLQEVRIPTVDQFRAMVSSGTKVSPMLEFFLAVGFPSEFAVRGVEIYETQFNNRYKPNLFLGVEEMLSELQRNGAILGIVTSNTKENVEDMLGSLLIYFDERCLFYYDRLDPKKTKAWSLSEGANRIQVEAKRRLYVGDQPSDANAAFQARWMFIGAGYGWGIKSKDIQYPIAHSIIEIPSLALRALMRACDDE